ncbi:MAG: Gfo/Idh/MocA family oxidoreductase [Planctomycetes bacterium]|nr:Gfo/Idh/MocA family oxidoreductase [Planctomycetota bacterium]
MKERKLKVGMLGAGGISRVHCEGWAKLPDCELAAITDLSKDACQTRAKEFNIPNIDATPQEMFAREDLDIIDIVVPNRFHCPFTISALQAGKHVLCEKPLALSVAEVDEMIAAAEKTGKKLMCAQHMRFEPKSQSIKEYMARRPLGEIYYARAWYLRRRQLPCTPGFMYRKNAGGGCCIDVGVHVLDLALFLMDNFSPASVSGISVTKLAKQADSWSEWGQIDRENIDVEDFAAGFIRFQDGSALSLECSFMLNMKPRSYSTIDLFGTLGGLKWPDCEFVDHTSKDFIDVKMEVREDKAWGTAHHAEIREFAQAVRNDKPVPVPPRQTRAVIAILEGLYQSARTGKEVNLK